MAETDRRVSAMNNSSDLELFIQELERMETPQTYLRACVKNSGGIWHDTEVPALFEIHFMGIAASGMGAYEAARNWIAAAKHSLSLDTVTIGAYSKNSGSVAQLVRAERS